jgi:hypothetical protein
VVRHQQFLIFCLNSPMKWVCSEVSIKDRWRDLPLLRRLALLHFKIAIAA